MTCRQKWGKATILRALYMEYERVRNASYERWDFGLGDIHMVHTVDIDNL